MKRPWALTLAVVFTVGLAAGCSSGTALTKARTSFDKARAAGAETKAPYEYYSAEAYLGLAEHEKEEGDRHGVAEFSETSEKFSAEALKKAGGGAK
ncbi:MAG: DUF4398 domain-containing protein [Deltaproteobacteria bacterium]|nr:DUF4398 domain-containing protein [Deltaproteobacteria bacterium]MDH3383470.1 DUF4398 domain-containing protein [Deltaproteobacteria bacterium]